VAEFDINVLDMTMVDGVLRHLDAGLVVFQDHQLWRRDDAKGQ
jgi:hypothetical protein